MISLDTVKYNLPGILVSVSKRGESIAHYCHGFADIAARIEMAPEQLLQIGQITRTFSATVALRLVEDGCVDLDSPLEIIAKENSLDSGRLHIIVSQYPSLKPVTLRELLNHSSGIASYDQSLRYQKMFCEKPKKVWQTEGYLDLISGPEAQFQRNYVIPVRGYYSDSATNYILVGLVIEAITGGKSSDNLQDLFMTQGLANTYYLPHGVLEQKFLSRMVHGYMPVSHPYAEAFVRLPVKKYTAHRTLQVYDVTDAYNYNGLGGSACLSTSTDLINWLCRLFSGKVLTSGIKEMFDVIPASTVPRNPADKDFYGLGIFKTISKRYGEIIWSAGNNFGYGVLLAYALESDICFVIAVNASRRLINLHQQGIVADVIPQVLP